MNPNEFYRDCDPVSPDYNDEVARRAKTEEAVKDHLRRLSVFTAIEDTLLASWQAMSMEDLVGILQTVQNVRDLNRRNG